MKWGEVERKWSDLLYKARCTARSLRTYKAQMSRKLGQAAYQALLSTCRFAAPVLRPMVYGFRRVRGAYRAIRRLVITARDFVLRPVLIVLRPLSRVLAPVGRVFTAVHNWLDGWGIASVVYYVLITVTIVVAIPPTSEEIADHQSRSDGHVDQARIAVRRYSVPTKGTKGQRYKTRGILTFLPVRAMRDAYIEGRLGIRDMTPAVTPQNELTPPKK